METAPAAAKGSVAMKERRRTASPQKWCEWMIAYCGDRGEFASDGMSLFGLRSAGVYTGRDSKFKEHNRTELAQRLTEGVRSPASATIPPHPESSPPAPALYPALTQPLRPRPRSWSSYSRCPRLFLPQPQSAPLHPRVSGSEVFQSARTLTLPAAKKSPS